MRTGVANSERGEMVIGVLLYVETKLSFNMFFQSECGPKRSPHEKPGRTVGGEPGRMTPTPIDPLERSSDLARVELPSNPLPPVHTLALSYDSRGRACADASPPIAPLVFDSFAPLTYHTWMPRSVPLFGFSQRMRCPSLSSHSWTLPPHMVRAQQCA